jgi:hypothetical protein
MRTYYDVLGVEPDVDDETIRLAFRMLAKCWHPDANGGDAWSEQRFKRLTAAYVTLRNSASRAAYDERLAAARRCREERRAREAIYYVIAGTVTVSLLTGGFSYFRPQQAAATVDAWLTPHLRSHAAEQPIPAEIGAVAREPPAYHEVPPQPAALLRNVEAYRGVALAAPPPLDRFEASAGTAVINATSAGEVAARQPTGRSPSIASIATTKVPATDDRSYPLPRDLCLQTGTCLGRAISRR